MHNIVCILCGFLTLAGLGGCTATKVDNKEAFLESARHANDHLDANAATAHKHPILELMSVSLDTWGSKARHAAPQVGHMVETVDDTHVVDPYVRKDLGKPAMMMISIKARLKLASYGELLFLLMVGLTLVCGLAILVHISEESEEDLSVPKSSENMTKATTPEKPNIKVGARVEAEFKGEWYPGTLEKLPDAEETQYTVKCDFFDVSTQVSQVRKLNEAGVAQCFCGSTFAEEAIFCKNCDRPRSCPCGNPFMDDAVFCKKCGKPRLEAGTQDDPIHQIEFSDGSWARAYREARGQRRQALELLLRCNIISTQEFAYSRVSQEHIDECVWIGTHMLKQTTLEEWVALWRQAQQTFEDSVTACFSARTDARSTYGPNTPGPVPCAPAGTAPRSEVPLLDCLRASAINNSQVLSEDDEGGDPYTTRSSLNTSLFMSSRIMSSRTDDGRFEHLKQVRKHLEGPFACVCGGVFMDDAAFCRKCGKPRSEVAAMEEKLPMIIERVGSTQSSQQNSGSFEPARHAPMTSPMILRCSEIMAAPPQEGVPVQQTSVERNASQATTVQYEQVRSEASLSPSIPSATVSPTIPPISPSMPWMLPSLPTTPQEVTVLPSAAQASGTYPPPQGVYGFTEMQRDTSTASSQVASSQGLVAVQTVPPPLRPRIENVSSGDIITPTSSGTATPAKLITSSTATQSVFASSARGAVLQRADSIAEADSSMNAETLLQRAEQLQNAAQVSEMQRQFQAETLRLSGISKQGAPFLDASPVSSQKSITLPATFVMTTPPLISSTSKEAIARGEVMVATSPRSTTAEGSQVQYAPLLQPSFKELIKERIVEKQRQASMPLDELQEEHLTGMCSYSQALASSG